MSFLLECIYIDRNLTFSIDGKENTWYNKTRCYDM